MSTATPSEREPGRLLLTGAAGFTGQHFQRAALEAGYAVQALRADLEQPAAVEEELSGGAFDSVVHLAAISAVTHSDELALYRTNLFGTLHLLRALKALARPPRRVLLVSSANVYGNSPRSPIAETAPTAPVNHYAMSKLAMEHMSAAHRDGLPLLWVRPFNYTGAGHDERFVIPKLVAHFARRDSRVELGNLDVEREFNDVRSVCEIYLRLLQEGVPGEVYNVCSGRAWSLREVIGQLELLSGHRMEIDVNPAFVRANEVRRLCGDPSRLRACIGTLPERRLEDTLGWMLESATQRIAR